MHNYSIHPLQNFPAPYPAADEQGTAQSSSQSNQSNYRIRCLRLPLAVYREVVAHLKQVDGVNAGLLPQTSREFSYAMSQVGGLWISYQPGVHTLSQRRVEEILTYYSDRFGAWEVIYTDDAK
jgi:hypothetical protein